MATIPLEQQFHTLSSAVDTVERGSAQTNSDRAVFTMQDITDTITLEGGVDGSGTTGMISKWSDANTLTDSVIEEISGGVEVTGQINLSALNLAPASAKSPGKEGEIRWTANYVYLCIATSTWVRAPLITWK